MANTLTNLNAEWWQSTIQFFLNNMLVAREICNTKEEALLSSGQTVNFPSVNDLTVSDYAQGTDVTPQNLTAANSLLTVDQSKIVSFVVDPVQEKQATSKYVSTMAQQAAFRLSNEIDKQVLDNCVTLGFTQLTKGAVSSSTLFSIFTDAYAQLFYQNATDRELCVVMDATRLGLLTQTFINGGFQQADKKLEDGFSPYAGRANNFKVYVSNNLPSSVPLTIAVQPTAGDTFTLEGATWTFRALGTAAAAGDISLGANVAATILIVRNAINNTGTPGASTYIDIAAASRVVYTNNDVSASAFAGSTTTITAVGPLNPSSVFTSVSNFFGTETTKMVFLSQGAPSLAVQMLPSLYIHPLQYQIGLNYMTHTLYGSTVFSRDTRRIVVVTINS
jgi:hypothetical protein